MDNKDEKLLDFNSHDDCPGLIRKFFIDGISGYLERVEFEQVLSSCGGKVQDFIIDNKIHTIEYFITTHNYYKFLEKLLNTKYSQNISFRKKVVFKYGKCSTFG